MGSDSEERAELPEVEEATPKHHSSSLRVNFLEFLGAAVGAERVLEIFLFTLSLHILKAFLKELSSHLDLDVILTLSSQNPIQNR